MYKNFNCYIYKTFTTEKFNKIFKTFSTHLQHGDTSFVITIFNGARNWCRPPVGGQQATVDVVHPAVELFNDIRRYHAAERDHHSDVEAFQCGVFVPSVKLEVVIGGELRNGASLLVTSAGR